jgi:hypothetical protein
MADVCRQKAVGPELSLSLLVLALALLLSVAPPTYDFDLRWENCREMRVPTPRRIPEEVRAVTL